MKSNNENTKLAAILTILLGLAIFSAQIRAEAFEDDSGISDFDDSGMGGGNALDSETIDVDGAFSYREQMEQRRKRNRIKRQEQSEVRRVRREENMNRLQDRQNDLIEEVKANNERKLQNKIGTIRIKSEKRLLKKLFNKEREESFNDGAPAAIPVPVIPTAPIAIMAAPAPAVAEEAPPVKKAEDLVDVGINFTSSHFDGKDVDMSSDSGFNLTISRQLSNNFSMGLSGGITSMSILVKDKAPSSYALGAVDTDYQRFHVELTGKTFFAATSLLRPYVQLGLGYNKVSLNLDEDQVKQYKRRPRSPYYSAKYYRHNAKVRRDSSDDENTEKLSKYILSGTTHAGVAFMFSKNLGLDLSAGYRYNFTTPFKNVKLERSRRHRDEEDRQKEVLTNLGRKLEKSSEISLNAGFTLRF